MPGAQGRAVKYSGRSIRLVQILVAVAVLVLLTWYLNRSHAEMVTVQSAFPGFVVIDPPEEVSALAIQGDIVWAGGVDGLFRIDRVTYDVLAQTPEEASFTYTRAILVDQLGRVWVGHDQGVSCLAGGRWQTLSHKDGLPDNRVNALAEDPSGLIWAGTWGGAVQIAPSDDGLSALIIRTWTHSDGLVSDMVNVILPDAWGGIWFGSYNSRGGISYLTSAGDWRYWTVANGLPHEYVTSIFQDMDMNVWVGTGLLSEGGAAIFQCEGDAWTLVRTMTQDDGLAGEKVRSIFQSQDGRMWLGSEYDGVAIFGPSGLVTTLDRTTGLSDNEVKVMVQDKDGQIWLGTRYGITVITDGLSVLD
ncbi:MAG: hypothetical protein EOM70_02325 [Clostridia bacterium]|nr:hypothetical protein [Clostridia bacterium]